MKEKLIIILRWILVLPSVVVTFFLAFFLLYFLGDPAVFRFDQYIEYFIDRFFAGLISVAVASYVAPSYHKQVSIVLSSVLCTIFIFATCVMISRYSEYGWVKILGNVLAILGVIAGSYIVCTEESKAR